jgi:predicted nuclease of predicted toxin-antitoxin system
MHYHLQLSCRVLVFLDSSGQDSEKNSSTAELPNEAYTSKADCNGQAHSLDRYSSQEDEYILPDDQDNDNTYMILGTPPRKAVLKLNKVSEKKNGIIVFKFFIFSVIRHHCFL